MTVPYNYKLGDVVQLLGFPKFTLAKVVGLSTQGHDPRPLLVKQVLRGPLTKRSKVFLMWVGTHKVKKVEVIEPGTTFILSMGGALRYRGTVDELDFENEIIYSRGYAETQIGVYSHYQSVTHTFKQLSKATFN